MDYTKYAKKFELPEGFSPPEQLKFEDILARPLTRADLKEDLAAVNSSIETIQKTRGGSWPEEELNEEFDLLDLAWHEREFREHSSLAYVIYDTNNSYIGCFYLYPMGLRTVLDENLLDYDVDASWWVTTSAYKEGHYLKLYNALQQWLSNDFPFSKVYYSNEEVPS